MSREALQDLIPHELGTDSHEIYRLFNEDLSRKKEKQQSALNGHLEL